MKSRENKALSQGCVHTIPLLMLYSDPSEDAQSFQSSSPYIVSLIKIGGVHYKNTP